MAAGNASSARPAPPASGRLALLAVAAAIVLQLAAVAPTVMQEIRLRLRSPVAWIIPAEMQRDVREIRNRIPDVEPILYVGDPRNRWLPRLWERALSPQPVVIVESDPRLPGRVARFRKRLAVRWALSAGSPPVDPGFAWQVRFAPIPGFAPEYRFGRLRR